MLRCGKMFRAGSGKKSQNGGQVNNRQLPWLSGRETIGRLRMKKVLLAVAFALAAPAVALAEGDAEAGKAVWAKCGVCHKIGEGAAHALGPALTCVSGRKAGSAEGYAYSEATKAAGFEWSDEKMLAWMEADDKVIPGNKMLFPAGVKDEADRANLLAYIKSECAAAPAAPAAAPAPAAP
jgi:cytochrome c